MFVVTGANGFIGSAMVWELNHRGHSDIIASDLVSPAERSLPLGKLKYTRYIPADDLPGWLTSPEARNLKAIFHMGACSSTTEMNTQYLKRVNTDYTRRLWEISQRQGLTFIYASSGAVYGDGQLGFDDASPSALFKPLNPYGWSKAHFDVWAEQQKQGPPRWYGLRFFNVYGPNEYHKGDMASVVFKAVNQILETGRLRLFRSHHPDYQDGEQLRDFVYVKDITHWMWQLWDRPGTRSGIYNMGFGRARTWLSLASSVFANLGREMQIEWIDVPESIRNQYQYFTEAKIDRLLMEKLDPPRWSLESGIGDYVRNYLLKDDPYLI